MKQQTVRQRLAAMAVAVALLACAAGLPPANGAVAPRVTVTPTEQPTHELNLRTGERFQVVCLEGELEYGYNGDNGIIGWCPPPAVK